MDTIKAKIARVVERCRQRMKGYTPAQRAELSKRAHALIAKGEEEGRRVQETRRRILRKLDNKIHDESL